MLASYKLTISLSGSKYVWTWLHLDGRVNLKWNYSWNNKQYHKVYNVTQGFSIATWNTSEVSSQGVECVQNPERLENGLQVEPRVQLKPETHSHSKPGRHTISHLLKTIFTSSVLHHLGRKMSILVWRSPVSQNSRVRAVSCAWKSDSGVFLSLGITSKRLRDWPK